MATTTMPQPTTRTREGPQWPREGDRDGDGERWRIQDLKTIQKEWGEFGRFTVLHLDRRQAYTIEREFA
jgi:hypothetical protein